MRLRYRKLPLLQQREHVLQLLEREPSHADDAARQPPRQCVGNGMGALGEVLGEIRLERIEKTVHCGFVDRTEDAKELVGDLKPDGFTASRFVKVFTVSSSAWLILAP